MKKIRDIKKFIAAVLTVIFMCAVMFTVSCGGGSETAVIVAGSTSVQPYVEMLAQEYKEL